MSSKGLSRPQTAPNPKGETFTKIKPQTFNNTNFQELIFEKLRQILHASQIPIEQLFASIDKDKSGDISNLEFINAIRNLNLGLNLREIEDLLLHSDSNNDGKIDFREFTRKFSPQ